jgi:hypothetical protein
MMPDFDNSLSLELLGPYFKEIEPLLDEDFVPREKFLRLADVAFYTFLRIQLAYKNSELIPKNPTRNQDRDSAIYEFVRQRSTISWKDLHKQFVVSQPEWQTLSLDAMKKAFQRQKQYHDSHPENLDLTNVWPPVSVGALLKALDSQKQREAP